MTDKTTLEQLRDDYLEYRDTATSILSASEMSELKDFFVGSEGISFIERLLLDEKLINLKDTISETLKRGASVAEPLAPFEICIVREEVKAPAAAPAPSSPTLDKLMNTTNTTATTKEETPMARTKVDMMKTGAKDIGRAIQAGAVQGTVGAINRQVVKQIEERLGDKFPEALKNEAGRKALELAIPSLVAMACAIDEQKKIPGHDHIQRAATLALTDASADAVSSLFGILFTEVMPFMQQYAEAGKMLADQEEVTEVEEVPDFSEMIQKQKAKARAA